MNAIGRRLTVIGCLLALAVAFGLNRAAAQEQRYVILQVTPVEGELSQGSPAINDKGEIVYEEFCNCPNSDVHRLVSTARGTIVNFGPNGRNPELNNKGEVVYVDLYEGDGTPGSGGLFIYSTERGRLARGNSPVIDDFGYIAADGVGEERFDLGIIRPDGSIAQINGFPLGAPLEVLKDRLLYYAANTEVGLQLFSTRAGQISNFGADVLSIAVNSIGKYVYSQYNVIYSERGDVLYTAPGPQAGAFSLDMNKFGDVVFVEFTDRPVTPKSRLLLLTRRPGFYERNYGFQPN